MSASVRPSVPCDIPRASGQHWAGAAALAAHPLRGHLGGKRSTVNLELLCCLQPPHFPSLGLFLYLIFVKHSSLETPAAVSTGGEKGWTLQRGTRTGS